MIKFRNEIAEIVPYKPGRPIADVQREYNLSEVVKLASNENPLGYSPNCKAAIEAALDSLEIYPDGNCTELKSVISEKFKIPVSNIAVSSGSDEMIDILSKVFIESGDEIIMSDVTFVRYIDTTRVMGGVPVVIPLKDWKYDLESMLEAITEKTKLIWLCNPNNPTGTIFTDSELSDFLKRVPKDIVVVYDEAYSEYVESDEYPKDSLKYLSKYENMIVMKTFSKAYGLAALRVGYSFASESIIENINKVRGPFNVNSIAQAAAIASIKDEDFLKRVHDMNAEGKKYIYDEFEKLGVEYVPSEANHIFFTLKRDSNEIFVALQKLGVIIRPILKDWLRVSIGTPEQNSAFIDALKKVLSK